jgi:hypothetical protein
MVDSAAITARKLEAVLKSRSMQVSREESERLLDAVIKFYTALETRKLRRAELLQQAAELMHRGFGFEEVSVLTKSPDGMFRYEIVLGYEKGPEMELRQLCYTESEISKPDTEACVKISKYIDLTIAEGEQKPGQTVGYAFPQLMAMPRKDSDDFTYGDYMDIYIYGKDDRHTAVFELSAPRDAKLPSSSKLKWMGLFALMMSNMLQHRVE